MRMTDHDASFLYSETASSPMHGCAISWGKALLRSLFVIPLVSLLRGGLRAVRSCQFEQL